MISQISVIGHRGWPKRFPDNTLPGIQAAADVCDAIEVDVRRTADGRLVLAHDPVIGNLVVADTAWPRLADIDLGAGARPCLLDEALSVAPGTPFLIEIKNSPSEPGFEPDHRLAIAAAARAGDRHTVISFNWLAMSAVRQAMPEARTGLNVGPLGSLDDAFGLCVAEGHSLVVAERDLVLRSDARDSDAAELWVWTPRPGLVEARHLDELVSRGVSGIITDDPIHTLQLLGRRHDDQG